MKIFFILAILLVLGVVNGDTHVDDTEKIFPDMMMNRQADDGGDHKSDFDQKQDSPNNLGEPFSCAALAATNLVADCGNCWDGYI
ncbi:hypothetical protein Pmar_PMAR018154 [Perkinsus marinus ATCC 50983]|uniref:Uncharacterized protein n=1 Tax=Perkinsus marinus (strain ATCC 50983 / TXsc) TaxID=423536 RepID=C5KFW8_PERM5|nr:hypothetical protein Pmar_PMAR018154 [Perkinsus marinus ATCC 50983]EER16616.1 hypothetical protein Pmar_PMAR018154 [Perkinsus marinus ATCC 50983]|eukprot:XP_002784820.1 hypothetical protein Pmar_PMAR018154 [Perkinsus marinus ATCC 50983]